MKQKTSQCLDELPKTKPEVGRPEPGVARLMTTSGDNRGHLVQTVFEPLSFRYSWRVEWPLTRDQTNKRNQNTQNLDKSVWLKSLLKIFTLEASTTIDGNEYYIEKTAYSLSNVV